MELTRRRLLELASAGSVATMFAPLEAIGMTRLRILILGGTGFLGPATIAAALGRGHSVTMFNRGKTRPELFPHVKRLTGDRDPKVGNGLQNLEQDQWDVVIDNGAYHPHFVRASAEVLAPRVKHYIIVSSISAYATPYPDDGRETASLATLPDIPLENMSKDIQYKHYGPLKALCEQAAEAAMPGRVTVVRPGYIVGPDDASGRFTYWPVRIHRGGLIAVPGERSDPVQIIDVRDLGNWLVSLAEQGTTGTFNACGPANRLSWGELIDTCFQVCQSSVRSRLVWIPTATVLGQSTVNFPIWAPDSGETRGFHTWSNVRARAAGLQFRPVAETLVDTLRWYRSQRGAGGSLSLAGSPPDAEDKLIKESLGKLD